MAVNHTPRASVDRGCVEALGQAQECRDCGKPFPYDLDADRCPACVAEALGYYPSGEGDDA